jgi:hypothetical protein
VAKAAGPASCRTAGRDIGWNAAMQARMARTCEAISTGQGTENREAEQQYRILEEFIKR